MKPLPAPLRARLLALARAAVHDALGDGAALEAELSRARPPGLCERRGVFVCLKRSGQLRGCVGRIQPSLPLWSAVTEVARSAAIGDPRFDPLRTDDLDDLHVEISVLGDRTAVDDPSSIVVGRDGVELRRGAAYSVFLPHVAIEQGWDRERLLRRLARKAGLPADAWRRADLATFAAEVFSDGPRRGAERRGAG